MVLANVAQRSGYGLCGVARTGVLVLKLAKSFGFVFSFFRQSKIQKILRCWSTSPDLLESSEPRIAYSHC